MRSGLGTFRHDSRKRPGNEALYTLASFHRVLHESISRHEPSVQRLVNRHYYLLWSGPCFCSVQDGAPRRSHADAIASHNVERSKWPRRRVNLDSREIGEIAPGAGNGEMDRVGEDVTELKQLQGAFVRYDGGVLAQGHPSGDDTFPEKGWIIAETIKPSSDANVLASPCLVGEQRWRKSAGGGLGSCEMPMLARCPLEKAFVIGPGLDRVTHKLKHN